MARVPTFSEIGERIREVRLAKGYDQSDLAQVLQVTRPVVTKIENGKKAINSIELKTIADFLNVSVDYLTKSVSEEKLVMRFRDQKYNPAFRKAVDDVESVIKSVITQIKLGSDQHG